jgi:hypothetical protein
MPAAWTPRTPFAKEHRRQDDGDRRLALQDQAGQPGRHVGPHGAEQKAELPGIDERADAKDRPP